MTDPLPASVAASSDLATQIAQFALDKKAEHILSIEVKKLTSITDYFVICSADTNIQVKAIADSIRKNTNHKQIRIEGYRQLNWVLLDYIDVIAHIFRTTERNYYNLEKLWADAPTSEYTGDNYTKAESSTG